MVDFTLERINDEDNQYLTEEILVRQRNFPPLGSGPEFDVKFTYPGPVDEGDEREREKFANSDESISSCFTFTGVICKCLKTLQL